MRTVPSIWKKGRPTDVCQFWGLLRIRLLSVSRMQTSLRRKHRDRVVRRGLALIIESDFYATDAGRQHFADQLTSIRYCVQEVRSTPTAPAAPP